MNAAAELKTAQRNFLTRREKYRGKQVKNSELVAGSPMYYYCRYCCCPLAILPEGHLNAAPSVCTACEYLARLGALPGGEIPDR